MVCYLVFSYSRLYNNSLSFPPIIRPVEKLGRSPVSYTHLDVYKRQIIASEKVPTVRLSQIFRQAEESLITVNAHRINQGLGLRLQSPSDFYFIRLEDAEETAEYVVDLAAKLADTFGLDNIQVLAPMHKYITGVQNLNNSLQQRLNPPGSGKKEYPFRDSCFRIGDKVMAIRNNYEKGIFNGNQGLVLDIVLSQEDEDVDEDTIWVCLLYTSRCV